MDFEELIVRNRSYRRFHQQKRISRQTLLDLVNIARRTASGGNRQPLRYALVDDPAKCAALFPHLKWAGLLRDWGGPKEGERPAAYVLILTDPAISKQPDCDVGIAAQSMLLAAAERGLGGCMIGSIDRSKVFEELGLPAHLTLCLIVALGEPAETCILEDAPISGSVAYYRDAASVHHVPKRRMEEIIIELPSRH